MYSSALQRTQRATGVKLLGGTVLAEDGRQVIVVLVPVRRVVRIRNRPCAVQSSAVQ
jgi:hypothetical protein